MASLPVNSLGERSTLAHTSEDQTRAWIQTMTQSALNGDTDFVVCLKPDFRPVGKIGAWQDHEIGFMLVRSLWGQGLAQEALGAVIPYLFFEKGFSEITADTDPRNAACIALLQKMGFVVYASQEKTWEVGGEWVDSLYFKLARESWQTPRDHRQGHQST